MAYLPAQLVDIRRHCGYGMFGAVATQFFGYRFTTQYGVLEYKMQNGSPEEEAVVTNYLTQLNLLETAIYGTSDNLDTDQAAVWTHNKNEQRDRERLFDGTRRRLCGFFGIPPGPGLDDVSGGSIALVV